MHNVPTFHSRTFSLALVVIATIALSGCSAFPFGEKLKPTVPEAARTSFVSSVNKKAGQNTATLDHVKQAFEDLYAGVRTESNTKDKQDWSYKETAATGGGAAALGHLASKTGLLNTGLAMAMVGLSVDSFYKPAATEATHLKAEDMFQCLHKELFFVSEADRKLAATATTGGADKASTAIRDSVDQVDSAITRYRFAILSQGASVPTKDDFARFAKQYGDDAAKADKATAAAASLVATKSQSQQDAKAEVDSGHNLSAGARSEGQKKLMKAENELKQAQASEAAAKFIPLATNLEACVKKFTP